MKFVPHENNSVYVQNPWFAENGNDSDVVLSSRVRLARNLVNFPFTNFFRSDDDVRVQALVFDVFSHTDDAEHFHVFPIDAIDSIGNVILTERGILDVPTGTGVVLQDDGVSCCVVNSTDHVRTSSFAAGLDVSKAYDRCRAIDEIMQEKLQFAASYDFGYLTRALCDAGSGMKISVRVHVPAMQDAGLTEKYFSDLKKQGFIVTSPFGVGGRTEKSLGAFYQINTSHAQLASEIDQLAAIYAVSKEIIETERKIRVNYAENKQTTIKNIILRAYAVAKFSMLLSQRECVDIISDLKWGVDTGIIGGVTDGEFYSLLYRIGDGHLSYLLGAGQFSFESDIVSSVENKLMRLRAVSVQETVNKICFEN